MTNPKPITLDDELKGPRQHVNVVKLTDKQQFDHEVLVSRTLMKAPLFSYLLLSKMEIVYTLDIPIAATDEFRILLNPTTFFVNYTADEQVFILCHEVFHKIRRDCALGMRYGRNGRLSTPSGWLDYDHGTGNKTADYIINAALVKAKIGKLPKDGLFDPSIATGDESFAEVYPRVYGRMPRTPPQGGSGTGPAGAGGSGTGKPTPGAGEALGGPHGSFDQHLAPGSATPGKDTQAEADKVSDAEMESAIAAALQAAKMRGNLPANLERILGQILAPELPWHDILRATMIRRTGQGGWNFRRPHRRLILQDMYAPSPTGFSCGPIVIAIDTSGSIGQHVLDVFFFHLRHILEDLQPQRIYVMWCDATVHRIDELEEPADLDAMLKKGAVGGGGTRFEPVWTAIEKEGIDADTIVYFTDGMGSFPTSSKINTIWALTPTTAKPPFGDVVNVKIDPL